MSNPAKLAAARADQLEAMGNTTSEDGAASAVAELTAALGKSSTLVREGAIYGLARLAQRFPAWAPDVVRALSNVAFHDPSPSLREAASECLEDLR